MTEEPKRLYECLEDALAATSQRGWKSLHTHLKRIADAMAKDDWARAYQGVLRVRAIYWQGPKDRELGALLQWIIELADRYLKPRPGHE